MKFPVLDGTLPIELTDIRLFETLSTTTLIQRDPGGNKDIVVVNWIKSLEPDVVVIVAVIEESITDMLNH